jgi:hypothetical protein
MYLYKEDNFAQCLARQYLLTAAVPVHATRGVANTRHAPPPRPAFPATTSLAQCIKQT